MDVRARRGRAADPRADLVAGDDAFEQSTAVEATFFGDGERAGNDVDRRMAAAEATALVDFQRDTRGGVRQRRPERSARPRWPSRVAAPCGGARAANRASSPFSSIALPATMAPSVSSSTSFAAATVEAASVSKRVAATKAASRSR